MTKKKKQKKGHQNANMDKAKKKIAEATTIRISQQLRKFLESKDEGINRVLI